MVSCADIPDDLLGAENFDNFVLWLHALVPNRADRKALGKCWGENSKVFITADMWRRIINPPEDPRGL